MAFDEALATRLRSILGDRKDVSEKRMFGGLTFMLGGNMCCGITKDDLVLRVGPEQAEKALARAHARPCDFTGRPMKGMIMIAPLGYATDEALRDWVRQAVAFASSLPAK